jgi:hypothetical protein
MAKGKKSNAPVYKPKGLSGVASKPSHKKDKKVKEPQPVNDSGSESDQKTVWKQEFKVTPEMFEAARLMPKGVTHVKDLDMTLVKDSAERLLEPFGSCEIIQISDSKVRNSSKPTTIA